jgi:hypothetical protein
MPSSKLRAMLPPLEGGSICFHAGPQSFVNLSHQILQADAARIAAALNAPAKSPPKRRALSFHSGGCFRGPLGQSSSRSQPRRHPPSPPS